MKIEIQTKEEALENLIASNKNELTRLEIQEKWLSSQLIVAKVGKNPMELQLGQIQEVIKEKKEFIPWLERHLEELKSA